MEVIFDEENRKKKKNETAAPFDVYSKDDVYLIFWHFILETDL